jgi:hypothetical protein
LGEVKIRDTSYYKMGSVPVYLKEQSDNRDLDNQQVPARLRIKLSLDLKGAG